MRKIGELLVRSTVLAWLMLGIGNSPVQAAEVLVNGNLESSVSPVGWSLTTSITGIPGSSFPDAVEHVDGADHYVAPGPPPPGLGLLLHPQKGNQGIYEDQDKRVNLVLEQTYGNSVSPATPGRTYTFSGDVFFQDGYSGIVTTLNPLYPKGDYNSNTVVDAADYVEWRKNLGSEYFLPQEGPGITAGMVTQEDYNYWRSKFGNTGRAAGVASPTQTKFEITFLNSSGGELGTTVYNLRDDPTTLMWRTGTDKVQAVAPLNTQKVRVRVSALNMVDNCCALGQDVFFDNFRLSDSFLGPASNHLTNGDLNTPGEPAGWTVTEGPTGTAAVGGGIATADSVAFVPNANRLSNIPNPNPTPPYATLPTGKQGMWLRGFVNKTQFEPDLVDVFGQASQVVPGTPGAQYTFSAWSAWESGYCGGLANTSTQTFMKIEFLNGLSVIGTQLLDLVAAGQLRDDNSGANENGGNVEFDDWRQFSLNAVAPNQTTSVRVSLGATGMFNNDLDGFQAAFFDEMSLIETLPGTGVGSTAVPEPGSILLVGIAVALAGALRRRRR